MSTRISMNKTVLSAAIAAILAPAVARADCAQDDTTFTCTDTDGVGFTATADPSVTINVEEGAQVDTSAQAIFVNAGADPGAVTITNNGGIVPGQGGIIAVPPDENTIGGTSLQVTGFVDNVSMDPDVIDNRADPDNDVTLTNSGVIEGSLSLGNGFFGAIGSATISNSGTIATNNGFLNVNSGRGISLTNSGSVIGQLSFSSSEFTQSTDADGVVTTTRFGGPISVTNSAGGTILGAPNVQTFYNLNSVGGVTFDNATGASLGSIGPDPSTVFLSLSSFQTNTVVDGGIALSSTPVGGPISFTNGGAINGSIQLQGVGDISVTNDGSLTENLNVFGSSAETVRQAVTNQLLSSTPVGGSVSFANTGTLDGFVTLRGVGDITATNDGTLGDDGVGGLSVFGIQTAFVFQEDTGVQLSSTPVGGALSFTNGGTIEGFLNLQSVGAVTATNNGTLDNLRIIARAFAQTDNGQLQTDVGGNVTTSTPVGGTVTVENTSALTIEGNVDIDAVGDVLFTNSGRIIGGGTTPVDINNFVTSSENTTEVLDPDPTTAADGTTTEVNTTNTSDSFTPTSGDVTVANTETGTIGTQNFLVSGFTGLNVSSIGDVTVTNDGSIFGGVNAGTTSLATVETSSIVETIVTPPAAPATTTVVSTQNRTNTRVGGATTVTSNGRVADSSFNVDNGDIFATGNGPVTVTVGPDGFVDDALVAFSSGQDSTSMDQLTTVNAAPTQILEQDSATAVGGSTTVDIMGTVGDLAAVQGNVTASSLLDSTVTVSGEVGGSLSSFSGGTDSSSTTTTESVTAMGVTTTTVNSESSSGPSASGGNSLVTVTGQVGGAVNSSASAGNATVEVGTDVASVPSPGDPLPSVPSVGSVTVDASGATTQSASTTEMVEANAPETLTTETSTIWQGGDATASIHGNVGGVLDVTGFGSATADVLGNGTVAEGSHLVNSFFTNTETSTTREGTTYDEITGLPDFSETTVTTVQTSSVVGGDASLTVAEGATLDDDSGTTTFMGVRGASSASIVNDGMIDGTLGTGLVDTVFVDAFHANTETVTTIENEQDLVRRVETVTTTTTFTGGDATFANTGVVNRNVSAAGLNSIVQNSGLILGSVSIGQPFFFTQPEGTTTAVTTVTSSPPDELPITPPETPTPVTGSVDNNGLIGRGIFVSSPGSTNAVNLNDGSYTYGTITAEQDLMTAEDLTTSTLNLNGSGFLGGRSATHFDPLEEPPFPGVFSGTGDVVGFAAANKTGAGTFVVDANYFDAAVTTISAGRLEFTSTFAPAASPLPAWAASAFDAGFTGTIIDGSVVNDSWLVAGSLESRLPPGAPPPLGSLTSLGASEVMGNDLWITGDFTQSGTGTLAVGIAPGIERAVDGVPFTFVNEPLGLPVFGLSRGPFGLPTTHMTTGAISVDGNTTLGGAVEVLVAEGVYVSGEQQMILSTTGTVSGSASVTTSQPSQFVGFSLAQVAGEGTTDHYVTVSRSPYAGVGGASSNQQAIAGGLDSAVPGVVTRIRDDLAGEAAFGSVQEFNQAQDLANLISTLDWDLTTPDDVLSVLGEMDGQFYASLYGLNLGRSFLSTLQDPRSDVEDGGLWMTFYDDHDDIGETIDGISDVRLSLSGLTFGFEGAVGSNGSIGVAVGASDGDVIARTRPESAEFSGRNAGIYGSWTFGGQRTFYIDAAAAYTWGEMDAMRLLPIFGREATAEFDVDEARINAEFGMNFGLGADDGATLSPYVGVNQRRMSRDGFTEMQSSLAVTGNIAPGSVVSGISLVVDDYSEDSTDPYIGVDLRWEDLADGNMAAISPYVDLRFTSIGADAELMAELAGGGDAFQLAGAQVDDFFSLTGGLEFTFSNRLAGYFAYSANFGDTLSGSTVTGGVRVSF